MRVACLVQGVHDEHGGQRHADGGLESIGMNQDGEAGDDEEAEGREKGGEQVVGEDSVEGDGDHHALVSVFP